MKIIVKTNDYVCDENGKIMRERIEYNSKEEFQKVIDKYTFSDEYEYQILSLTEYDMEQDIMYFEVIWNEYN